MKHVRKIIKTVNTEPSMTDQQYKKECDVNHIMAKFKKTGVLPNFRNSSGTYADVSEIPDLLGAMSQLQHAQQAFDALPSNLRKRFGHRPEEMVSFLQDPRNDEEAVKLGLKTIRQTSDKSPEGSPTVKSGAKAKPPKKETNEIPKAD